MPRASVAITMAMIKTNQNTSLPRMLVGVCLISALSKNCFMQPRSIQCTKPMPPRSLVTTT